MTSIKKRVFYYNSSNVEISEANIQIDTILIASAEKKIDGYRELSNFDDLNMLGVLLNNINYFKSVAVYFTSNNYLFYREFDMNKINLIF